MNCQKLQITTLRIEKIIFERGCIVRFTKIYSVGNILFQNCHFENIITDRKIVRAEHLSHWVHFHQCNFINSSAQSTSRAISIYGTRSTFSCCSFINNLSTDNQSIALVRGNSTFINSNFENNTVSSEFGVNARDGAIYTNFCSVNEIQNLSFKNNKAASAGGAISHSGEKLIVKLSSFELNILSGKSSNGGATFMQDTSVCEIFRGRFIGNEAGYFDGAICSFNGKELRTHISYFENNSAVFGGAINCFSKEKLREKQLLEELFVYNKTVIKQSGAIFIFYYRATSYISSSIFKGNRVKIVYSSGGAITFKEEKIVIKASSFHHNSAYWGIAFGSFRSPSALTMGVAIVQMSSFEDNNASSQGGTTAFMSSDVKSVILNRTFTRNNTTNFGGAIVSGKEKNF